MKTSIFNIIFCFLSFTCFLWYSCDSSLPIVDVPYAGDQLVLNGAIFPQGVAVHLSHSSGPFAVLPEGHKGLFLENGLVELVDSISSERFVLDNEGGGNYTLNKTLQIGYPYKLVAQSPDYETVESDWVYIPGFTPMDSLQVALQDEGEVFSTIDLKFNFQDERSKAVEYYLLNVWLITGGERVRLDEYFNLDGLTTQSCEFSTFFYVHFPDVCFDGTKFPLDMTLRRSNITAQDSLYLEFGKISELYYSYFDYLDQPDDALGLAFSDPSIIPSNIQGGYGLVASKNSFITTLPLKQ